MNRRGVSIIEMLGILAIITLLVHAASNMQTKWKMKKYGDVGYIATVSHVDRFGVERQFKVKRWLENGKDYVRFEAQNGDIITFKEQEVYID